MRHARDLPVHMPCASAHDNQGVDISAQGVFITAVPIIKLFAWGEGDSGGHVLRETTSRGLCGLVCPSRTQGGWCKPNHQPSGDLEPTQPEGGAGTREFWTLESGSTHFSKMDLR
jgi:hypothetical protein